MQRFSAAGLLGHRGSRCFVILRNKVRQGRAEGSRESFTPTPIQIPEICTLWTGCMFIKHKRLSGIIPEL
jgi:hypothetical protein